jgi:hypothetical protein
VTYAGVIVTGPAFAALHDQFHLSYGNAFAVLSLVTVLGIGCVVLARQAVSRKTAATS